MRRGKAMLGGSVVVACAVIGLTLRGRAAPTTQRPSSASSQPTLGVVQGTIRAQADVPLAEMVVYLDSPDPSRKLPASHETIKVSQKGAKFDPQIVVISVGQTIEFLNDEDRLIEHNVFSNSPPKRFDLGLYGPGQSKKVQFDKPGPVFLYCSIHRYMDGVVFVAPTPYFSRVDKDGAYRIENVPPGQWTLKTWQRRRRFPEQAVPVTVSSGQPSGVDLELKKK